MEGCIRTSVEQSACTPLLAPFMVFQLLWHRLGTGRVRGTSEAALGVVSAKNSAM
jgi:hypothetical protein